MTDDEHEKPREAPPLSWRLFYFVLVLGGAGAFYTLLRFKKLNDTAVLYVGLPLVLALGLSLTPRTSSAFGATIKGITIALLLSMVFFAEGTICIIFAAPIFLVIGALIAFVIDMLTKRSDKNPFQLAAITTVLGVLSLEGTTDLLTFRRENIVSVTRTVSATPAEVMENLAEPPKFDDHTPWFLRIFPYPTAISGHGLAVGDQRHMQFTAYKHIWWTRVEGTLKMRVTAATPHSVTFTAEADDSYLSHYLTWKTSTVLVAPAVEGSQVTWTLVYDRKLDPSWYFGPLERYAVLLAAEELIDGIRAP
jgi:hypothetical protein